MMRRNMRSRTMVLPRWVGIGLGLTCLLVALFVTFFILRTVQAVYFRPLNPVGIAEQVDGELPSPNITVDGGLSPVISITNSTSIPRLEGDERVTVLVMGIDRRPGEPFISRTDSMMLLSINPRDDSASILSIPRDLFVDIPGYQDNRINTAFLLGSQTTNNPASGARLAIQTIELNLGIRVDHYVLVDFATVINVIDELGGVTLDVPYEIFDPEYPDMNFGYDPFYIDAGVQTLTGDTALKYMRTRHADSDFNRAARQQQVILALRDQSLDMGFAQLVLRGPELYNLASEGIFTDMSLNTMLSLAQAANDIPEGGIQNEVLDYDYVVGRTTPGGASVVELIDGRIEPLVAELFAP